MPGLHEQEYVDSDFSDNEDQHSKLLVSISQLDSTQRVKPASRKELASKVSEYHLTKGTSKANDVVNVKELAQVLGNKAGHVTIAKKFRKVTEKSKTLPKPLEKPVKDRLTRSIGFENVKKQLQRWDAIVTRNALQDHLVFPLNDNSMQMQPSNEFLGQFKSATPLEKEIAKVLKQDTEPKNVEDDDFPLTLQEMMEKRREMAQLRAKLSYKEAKAQRQSKIKSKKYHRILKREKLRQQLKEFELLQKTDPEAALKKLSELDKSRAQERASLRHRNTGQWAKNLAVRAKYDVESRKILAEQLKMSREITQKVQKAKSSDEEEEEEVEKPIETAEFQELSKTNSAIYENNPWFVKVSTEVADFVSGYRKYWDEKNKETSQSGEEKQVNENEEKNIREKGNVIHNGGQSEPTESLLDSTKLLKRKSEESQLDLKKNKINEISKKKSKKKKKCSPNEKAPSVAIHPASGVWIVTSVEDDNPIPEKPSKKNENKKGDIDSMFEILSEKLTRKAEKKLKGVKSKLESKKKRKRKSTEKKNDEEFDLTLKNKKAVERPDLDEGLLEGDDDDVVLGGSPPARQNPTSASVEIDPKNFIHIKPKKLNTCLPDNETGGEDAVDDEEEQRKAIEEAFGDDDVIAEFKDAKAEEEKKKEVEIFGSLPGWGVWGGAGVRPPRRKKRRMMVKLPPRKDHKKDDMIINENENPNLKSHLVKEVPHPFKSVEAFEANIRAPVGRDWVPETAHRKLIQKPVETKLGAVIEPMKEDEIVRLGEKRKSPYKGKKKNKEK